MVKRLCLAWKRNKQNKDKGVEPTGACSLFAQKTPESKQKENIMKSKMFEKETFKKEVVENVKYLYRKTMDEASEQEIFQAVSYVVKDVIIDQWLATQQEFDKADPKIVYYMSMEFLMGRGKTCCLLYGIFGNSGISGIWLWNPLPLWNVPSENREWLSGRRAG